MNNFYLSKNKNKVFPTTLEVEGGTFSINSDFRDILKIMRMMEDEQINDKNKLFYVQKWFFDCEVPREPFKAFLDFLGINYQSREETPISEPIERQYCFEFDAEEIYISFLVEYNIDLIEIPFLHWYKFKILLDGLSSESIFKQKLRLRFNDLKDYTGKELTKMQELKESIQLPIKLTEQEIQAQENFENKWGKVGM